MKKIAALLVLALASLALVACGSSDDSTSSTPTASDTETTAPAGGASQGGGETISFEADPGGGLAYTADKATAKAGTVTVDFNNPQALSHDVAIEDASGEDVGETDLVEESSTSTVIDDLKPGTYTFYCTVPGHREAGMEGTLTVK